MNVFKSFLLMMVTASGLLASADAFGWAGAAGGFAAGVALPTFDFSLPRAAPRSERPEFGRFTTDDYHGQFRGGADGDDRYNLHRQGGGRYFVIFTQRYTSVRAEFGLQCQERTCGLLPGFEGRACPSLTIDLLPDGNILVRNQCRPTWGMFRYVGAPDYR